MPLPEPRSAGRLELKGASPEEEESIAAGGFDCQAFFGALRPFGAGHLRGGAGEDCLTPLLHSRPAEEYPSSDAPDGDDSVFLRNFLDHEKGCQHHLKRCGHTVSSKDLLTHRHHMLHTMSREEMAWRMPTGNATLKYWGVNSQWELQ